MGMKELFEANLPILKDKLHFRYSYCRKRLDMFFAEWVQCWTAQSKKDFVQEQCAITVHCVMHITLVPGSFFYCTAQHW